MNAKILVDNDKELEVIQPLNLTADEENLVWACDITIAPINLDDKKRYVLDYITSPTTRRKVVISVWIDNNLYFTGFWSSGEPVITREKITCTIKLESKTADIRDSTYIPPAYDRVNGISQFSTDGKLTYMDIIKQSLSSLSWNIVDPVSNDGERRLSDYKSIAIIDKSKTALTKISIDKKTHETTEVNVVIQEDEALDSAKLSAARKTLAPRVTERVGAFLTSLANELGKMLTTNEYGDLVITDAAEVEMDIDPIKRFVYIPGDQRNNILQINFSSNDSGIYHKYIRLDQSGKLSLGESKKIVTIEEGATETGKRKGVSFAQTMIPSINDNARETRVLAYVNDETVEVQQQLANQEMYAKTAEARSTNFKIQVLSPYYEGRLDEIMPSYGTPIRPGDFVYIYIYNPLNDEIYDGEIRYVSQVDISVSRNRLNCSIELKLPKFFSNPSIRQRRASKPRALSSF